MSQGQLSGYPSCRDGTQMWFYRGVMAAEIGRLLTPQELVHHINEDPADDRPENLELTTRAAHLETHRPQHDQAKRAASLRAAADRMGADERRARALRVWETRRARGT